MKHRREALSGTVSLLAFCGLLFLGGVIAPGVHADVVTQGLLCQDIWRTEAVCAGWSDHIDVLVVGEEIRLMGDADIAPACSDEADQAVDDVRASLDTDSDADFDTGSQIYTQFNSHGVGIAGAYAEGKRGTPRHADSGTKPYALSNNGAERDSRLDRGAESISLTGGDCYACAAPDVSARPHSAGFRIAICHFVVSDQCRGRPYSATSCRDSQPEHRA